MTELNGREFEVKYIDKRHFSIGDTRSFGNYTSKHRSGYGNQVIVPRKLDFIEFSESFKNLSTMQLPFDFCTLGQDHQVILAFVSSQHHLEKQTDKSHSKVSGDELLESAKEINSIYKIVDEIDEELIREFARELMKAARQLVQYSEELQVKKFLNQYQENSHQFINFFQWATLHLFLKIAAMN